DDKESEEEVDEVTEEVLEPEDIRRFARQLVKRIRLCIGNIRSTRAIIDFVHDQAKRCEPSIDVSLVPDFEIRWNTTFIMINRFISYRSIIDTINSQPFKVPDLGIPQQMKMASKQFEFTNDDWYRIDDLRSVLRPFLVSTNI